MVMASYNSVTTRVVEIHACDKYEISYAANRSSTASERHPYTSTSSRRFPAGVSSAIDALIELRQYSAFEAHSSITITPFSILFLTSRAWRVHPHPASIELIECTGLSTDLLDARHDAQARPLGLAKCTYVLSSSMSGGAHVGARDWTATTLSDSARVDSGTWVATNASVALAGTLVT